MKKISYLIFSIFSLIFTCITYATPSEIIIIRHADKLKQNYTGPAIDPTGYVRAVRFAFYFLDHFGQPNDIVTTNPSRGKSRLASIRELQTIAPLVNIIQQKDPEIEHNIYAPYLAKEYSKLANFLLTNKRFDDQLVLICWDHTSIPKLVNLLGVTDHLPNWPSEDFDSVYILKYHHHHLISYQLLNNQYPVTHVDDWRQILQALQDKIPANSPDV